MSKTKLKLVLPPVDDPYMWKKTCNFAFGHKQDVMFRWLKGVQAYVEKQENEKKRGAA